MQYKHVVCTVQCLVCSMKCTCKGAGACACAGAGAVSTVQFSVYCVLPAISEDFKVETGLSEIYLFKKQ